jgi:hypothetical protein
MFALGLQLVGHRARMRGDLVARRAFLAGDLQVRAAALAALEQPALKRAVTR